MAATVDEKLDLILEEIRQLKERFEGWDRCLCQPFPSRSAKKLSGVWICDSCQKTAKWAGEP